MTHMTQQDIASLLARQNDILNILVKERSEDLKTKHTAGADHGTNTPLHGPGGIWTGAGLEPDIISAHVRPTGLASRLPLIGTVFADPLYGILTGFTDVVGEEPTKACQPAPKAYLKGCTQMARLGMLRRDSQTIDLTEVMTRLHRGDFTDLKLRGQVLGLTNLPPQPSQGDILNVVTASEMVNMGVQVERALTRQLWQGDPALNQFPGLDRQIATGHVDALTNVACPAVDSDVKNFDYDLVNGGGRDIVEYISMLEFYLRHNATRMGLDPVTWVWVMRPELWHELTAVWPCRYNTNRCSDGLGANAQTVVLGKDNVAERDAMRNGLFLIVNGNRYEVVLDDGIFEHDSTNNVNVPAGQYASSIYFVPLTAGGMTVTYREYLDFTQASSDLSATNGGAAIWWTDNGVYSWALSQKLWCIEYHLITKQRVIIRATHLAGRIDAVRYAPLQHLRDPYPDSAHHFDGGVSLRETPLRNNAVWLPQ